VALFLGFKGGWGHALIQEKTSAKYRIVKLKPSTIYRLPKNKIES